MGIMNEFDATMMTWVMIMIAVFFACIALVIVMLVVTIGKVMRSKSAAINQKTFDELSRDLKADYAIMQSELTDVKETLNSINKMMKDIQ